ncbi:hypothetical protein HH214_19815 [Mucilaginibacter robiniae]|uniref:Uncharacterized protein n=1 Tax=Mucilaginibacter robiniae TaxID=2728022 RepID=A0A7L5EAK7_9SPHI|nr:hypothetical protein [Mucilaginibacter robiniae]QJD97963.1 hypothetical protein HH214_19815 [Mucilaginibacter robiniae]
MKYKLSFAIGFIVSILSAHAQKWQPGYFYDTKGNKVNGLIEAYPSGKGPIKTEGFINYKADAKSNEIKLSASELQYFIAGKDSFVVAHAPQFETWKPKDPDFVKVVLDEPLKLYVYGGSSSGGGFRIRPDVAAGIGGGNYGAFGGGGIGLTLGNGGSRIRNVYYFGANTAEMQQVTPQNFVDVMSDIMADEPQAVEAIQSGKYRFDKIQALVKYYETLKSQTHNP